jgi:hypothetical protein
MSVEAFRTRPPDAGPYTFAAADALVLKEEPQPACAILSRGDLQAQDPPVALGVHARRQQRVHVHRPAGLADVDGLQTLSLDLPPSNL